MVACWPLTTVQIVRIGNYLADRALWGVFACLSGWSVLASSGKSITIGPRLCTICSSGLDHIHIAIVLAGVLRIYFQLSGRAQRDLATMSVAYF